MRAIQVLVVATCLPLGVVSSAAGQSLPFSRPLQTGAAPSVTIETTRGQIDVRGTDGPLQVEGTVDVRVGWNVPADAVSLARAAAAAPPIEVNGDQVRLKLPADQRTRDAVIIHWRVRVPRAARVVLQTQSGAVRLADVSGAARIRSGSSGITVRDARGGLEVDGQSGAIDLTGLAGPVRVLTGSGGVRVGMGGEGTVDAETQSSAIVIDGATAGVRARSGSGAIEVAGTPTGDWQAETRSSQIHFLVPQGTTLRLDLRSRSGRVTSNLGSDGTANDHAVEGGGSGPLITARSGSGAITVKTAPGS